MYSSTGGGTNWDDALQTMSGSGADIVFMITDGNPTTSEISPNGGGGTVFLNDLETGIASANSLKAESTILGIGVGSAPAVTAANIAAISGPAGQFSFTSSLEDIANTLKQLANQLCGSRIHVKKLVNDTRHERLELRRCCRSATNVSYPNGHATDANGVMQINLDNVPASPTGATNVSVTETDLAGHPGFSLQGSKCVKSSTTAYPTQAEAIAAGATNPRPIGTVQRNEDWWCTYVNQLNVADTTTVTTLHDDGPHRDPEQRVGPAGHDRARLRHRHRRTGAGTPTGNVTFTFFSNDDLQRDRHRAPGP